MDETGALVLDEGFWSTIELRNESGVDVDRGRVIEHLRHAPEVAALTDWALETQPSQNKRAGWMSERDRYVVPGGVYEQFKAALRAAEHDDVVSGVCESTEALAFSKMRMEVEEEDQEDVWNQIARDLDLDSRLREMWHELFIYSQVIVGTYWGTKSYTVRGTTRSGTKRKKTYRLRVPLGITMMDPFKIAPVGGHLFGQERLVYMADPDEAKVIEAVISGREIDPFIRETMVGRFVPDESQTKRLSDLNLSTRATSHMYTLNPLTVFRHTDTKPQYHPFAAVRLKSIFELLDLKNNLRHNDRAHLIGGTNFIIVITKGSDQKPATQKEINALAGYARTLARVPMLIGDHRLNVNIVTPKQDFVLLPEKHNVIDARISARLYMMFLTGGFSAGTRGDKSVDLARMVARGLESRRHQLKRFMERKVFQPILDGNDDLTDFPDLRFTPKRIALDFDPNMAIFMKDLHDMGNLSRDTLLSEFDFDEDEEYRKRKRAKESGRDELFQTAVPFSSPQAQPFGNAVPQSPRDAGRNRGGNRNGGGAAPGTGQGQQKAEEEGHDGDL